MTIIIFLFFYVFNIKVWCIFCPGCLGYFFQKGHVILQLWGKGLSLSLKENISVFWVLLAITVSHSKLISMFSGLKKLKKVENRSIITYCCWLHYFSLWALTKYNNKNSHINALTKFFSQFMGIPSFHAGKWDCFWVKPKFYVRNSLLNDCKVTHFAYFNIFLISNILVCIRNEIQIIIAPERVRTYFCIIWINVIKRLQP